MPEETDEVAERWEEVTDAFTDIFVEAATDPYDTGVAETDVRRAPSPGINFKRGLTGLRF